LSPEVSWFLKDRGYRLERWQRPLWRTPEPRSVPGAVFDPDRVDRVIGALKMMRHSQGKWAGHPLAPDAWQVAFAIAPIFGWVRPDGDGRMVRIIRTAWIEVPRKNGKTTLSAGLGLFLAFADGEPGAQVIAAAGSREQASYAYRPAMFIVQSSPAMKAAGVKPLHKEIVRESDQSFMKAVGSVGDLLQGSNPNGAIVDELHVHKNSEVIDAIESGQGARDQPLTLIITTANDGDKNSVYAQRRRHIEDVCRGAAVSPSEYGVVFAAPASADPWKESTWRRANPGYGVTPTKAFMESEAAKAKESPAQRARFFRLNLNRATPQETRFIDMKVWDRNRGLETVGPDDEGLNGRKCFGGVDLASVSDLSSLCLLFPKDEGGFVSRWWTWTPEENLEKLDSRTNGAASQWVDDGFLTLTPGNVMDFDWIRAELKRLAERFDIQSIGFDPFNATQLVNDLVSDGLNMVKVRQGFITLSPPTKEMQRLLLKGTTENPGIEHGGNPVARWCVDNLGVEIDPAGNVKPSKKKSGDKIDCVAALVDALTESTAAVQRASAYESHDLIIA
jgi:phage terminase large subunit-like protein